MTPPNGNASPRILWWITGAILGPIVLATFSSILSTTYTNVAKVGALEATLHQLQRDIQQVHDKLDKLIERR